MNDDNVFFNCKIDMGLEGASRAAQLVKKLLAIQEATCNALDLSVISELGRYSGKGNGNLL